MSNTDTIWMETGVDNFYRVMAHLNNIEFIVKKTKVGYLAMGFQEGKENPINARTIVKPYKYYLPVSAVKVVG